MAKKLVLAYSGGLDTSVAIRWLKDKGWDVIAFTVDLGETKDLDAIQARALKTGASAAYVADGRAPFLELFVWPSLQAGAVYEKEYPLATALGRPLIAAMMVEVARREGATAVAHGCTGKGNDQVRFDVATAALAPELQVIAPVREWGMNRDDEIDYATKHGIEVPATLRSPYSTDENLWGRSIEAGVLEDPWAEPPPDVYSWTRDARQCPDEPAYVEIGFKQGLPVSLDGKATGALELVTTLNRIGGDNGVGRIDHLENRLIGIKSREIYEAPAAVLLLQAHQALEDITLPKEVARFKDVVAQQWAQLVYDGLWFSLFGTPSTRSWPKPRLTSPARCESSCSKALRRWSVERAPSSSISSPLRPMGTATHLTSRRRRASSSCGGWGCARRRRSRGACMLASWEAFSET
jgi:argininosuccinate synthase